MKVAIFSSHRYERDFLDANPEILASVPALQVQFLQPRLHSTTAALAKGADAVCIFVNDDASASTLQKLSDFGVKLILLRCAGFNHVDISTASSLGMTVLRVPAYSPYAVAEFAVALLLTVARKTHKAFNRIRDGNFALNGLMGFDVHGKTVGVIGTGKIGRIFAGILKNGFGAKVIAYDIYPSQEAKDMGIEYVEKVNDLYKQSDIISLHCPLLPSTKRMIDKEAISLMKKGVVLVNTSRGELVDMDALIEGIRSLVIGACGMDVVEGEQALFFEDHSGEILENDRIQTLISFPNVLITPHIAFCTDTAMGNIWGTTVSNFVQFMEKRGKDNDSTSSSTDEKLTNEVLPQQHK